MRAPKLELAMAILALSLTRRPSPAGRIRRLAFDTHRLAKLDADPRKGSWLKPRAGRGDGSRSTSAVMTRGPRHLPATRWPAPGAAAHQARRHDAYVVYSAGSAAASARDGGCSAEDQRQPALHGLLYPESGAAGVSRRLERQRASRRMPIPATALRSAATRRPTTRSACSPAWRRMPRGWRFRIRCRSRCWMWWNCGADLGDSTASFFRSCAGERCDLRTSTTNAGFAYGRT